MLRLALLCAVLAASACTCGPGGGPQDAGPDAGKGEGEGEGAGGEGEGVGPDGGPNCTSSTPGFGTPCAGPQGENPPCGTFQCNPIQDQLVCNDPGPNACGFCGQLDQSVARVGEPCGVALCGSGVCPSPGDGVDGGVPAVICAGADTPRNACGGCSPLSDGNPGDVCSTCQTGTETCTTDENHLVCFHGRAAPTSCGASCNRCILFHAFMADRVTGGGFLEPGTVAIVEDVGNGQIQLTFDPLVAGPGASALPLANVEFSSTEDGSDFPFPLTDLLGQNFTTNIPGQPQVLMDPVRQYIVSQQPSEGMFVLLVDQSGLFSDPVISIGTLVSGAPPDAGP